jgi:hypothetical protein
LSQLSWNEPHLPAVNSSALALAAWRSRHRIRLKIRSPGFESRQGIRFLGRHSNAVIYNRVNMHSLCFEKER